MGATDACTGFLLKYARNFLIKDTHRQRRIPPMRAQRPISIWRLCPRLLIRQTLHDTHMKSGALRASCRVHHADLVMYWNCKDCGLNCKSPRFRSRKSESVDAGSAVASEMTAADCTALCRSEE